MSVLAPPKPPASHDRPDLGELEALIKEARQRARRRRQRNAAIGFSVLLLGLAVYVGFARGGDGVTSLLSASPAQGPREAGASTMTFRLLATPTSFRQVDLPPKGIQNRGDMMYVKSVLRNWTRHFGRPANAVVGSDAWILTTLEPGWALVKAEVKLPGGTLRLQGRVHVSSYVRYVPVVGGTGRFANARGTLRFQSRSAPNLNDYRLRIPT